MRKREIDEKAERKREKEVRNGKKGLEESNLRIFMTGCEVAERPPGGMALNQGSVVGSSFSGAFKCFRSCLECRKRLSEMEAETGFLIGTSSWPPHSPSIEIPSKPRSPFRNQYSLIMTLKSNFTPLCRIWGNQNLVFRLRRVASHRVTFQAQRNPADKVSTDLSQPNASLKCCRRTNVQHRIPS